MDQLPASGVSELLKDMLRDLSSTSPILGAAVLSIEGLPLVSHFHAGTEDAAVAAMVASIYATGQQTVRELRQGALKSVIIQGDMGTTVVVSISPEYLLAVTAPENVKLGLVFNDSKQAARKAAKLLLSVL